MNFSIIHVRSLVASQSCILLWSSVWLIPTASLVGLFPLHIFQIATGCCLAGGRDFASTHWRWVTVDPALREHDRIPNEGRVIIARSRDLTKIFHLALRSASRWRFLES